MKTSKIIGLAGTAASASKNSDLSVIAALKAFFRMIIKTVRGKYSPRLINLLIGSAVILYVISPLDLIPGIIIDDAAIVFFALKYFRKELNRFLEWEKQQKSKPVYTDALIIND